jgi:predicted transcriptional regulator
MATEQKTWVSVRLDQNLRDAIEDVARRDQRTISSWVRVQIDRALAAERQKEAATGK